MGAPLYEIDSEAEATVEASAAVPAATPDETTTATETVQSTTTTAAAPPPTQKPGARIPLIKFLGKEGWALKLSGRAEPEPVYIPPNYGRPAFSEEEMEALILGGANLAP